MKQQINEIKRMQRIAGLITESEYQESLLNENDYDDMEDDDDDDFDITAAFKASPEFHSYEEVLDVIESYEDDEILEDFKAKFPEGKDISREDYSDFTINYVDDMSEVAYIQTNWISISDPDIYDKAGMTESQMNENEDSLEKTISFGPYTNLKYYDIPREDTVGLIVDTSDNFGKIQLSVDTKGKDFYSSKQILYLNDKLEDLADEMSDYLTKQGIENEIVDNPIGYGQEIDNLEIEISKDDLSKLK